jgi:hypothetical protein
VLVPEDNRLRSGWISYCDWDVLLEGMEWQMVKDLCKKPTTKDPYYRVVKAFKQYLGEICAEMKQGGHTIRHMMLEDVK